MDLIKIGKYIASKRKELGLTQKQLAEKLGMSDKSVSKWERGICLPDVSIYSELCLILGISINEFLAGEDLVREDIEKKSEENIIGIATDSKHKQKRLKILICALLIISLVFLAAIGAALYQDNKPVNVIAPVPENSVEMQTVSFLSGPDEAYVYSFTTTDEYAGIHLYVLEYHSGELVSKTPIDLEFENMGSPKSGEILLVPEFEDFLIKVIISTDSAKISSEIPILTGIEDREYYGRSATGIENETEILYDNEQPLAAMIYGKNGIWAVDINDLFSGEGDLGSNNDYMYLFSYEFFKE